MPALTPITDCDESTFKAIANAKTGVRRKRLQNAWPLIESRYADYVACVPNLENLAPSPLSRTRASDCKHCYDRKTKAKGELIKKILDNLPANGSPWCQYCLIGEVDAVDHYVPKSLYPEFSVLPRNLVASCPKCNRLKNAKWLRAGVREIFSLYYDDLPITQYLFVDVDFPGRNRARVSFRLQRPAGMDERLFRRLERQFEILELISRYNKAGAWYTSEAAKASENKTRASIKKWFDSNIHSLTTLCGVNHCRAVLYSLLSTSNDFMTLVKAK
jgi:5-methylcytosine-specific restriction endonuclease McrA